MTNAERMILSDAIKNCFEAEEKVIKLRRQIRALKYVLCAVCSIAGIAILILARGL